MASRPSTILSELIRFLREIYDGLVMDITPDTYLADIPGVDSLCLLRMVAHLEEYFQVEIDTLALDEMRHVRDVVRAVDAAWPHGHSAGNIRTEPP